MLKREERERRQKSLQRLRLLLKREERERRQKSLQRVRLRL